MKKSILKDKRNKFLERKKVNFSNENFRCCQEKFINLDKEKCANEEITWYFKSKTKGVWRTKNHRFAGLDQAER